MKKIIGGFVAVALLAAGVFIGIESGVLFKHSDKVLMAFMNTVSDPGPMVESLKGLTILSEAEFTIDMVDRNGENTKTTKISSTLEEKQVTQDVHYVLEWALLRKEFDMGYTVAVDNQYVKVAVPSITDKLLVYDYTTNSETGEAATEETAAIEETEAAESETSSEKETAVGKEVALVTEPALTVLQDLNEEVYKYFYKTQFETTLDELKDAFLAEWDSLEFKRVWEGKGCYVDGEWIDNCKGYNTTIIGANLWAFIDQAERILKENYGLEDENLFQKWKEKYGDISDLDVTFYIYENKVASIVVKDKEEATFTIEIAFQGGTRRTQDVEVTENGEVVLKIDGETEGSVETVTVTNEEGKTYVFEYDSANGNYSAESEEESIKGTITNDDNAWKITMDEKFVRGIKTNKTSEIVISKGATLVPLDGEAYNINAITDSKLVVAVKNFFSNISTAVNQLIEGE